MQSGRKPKKQFFNSEYFTEKRKSHFLAKLFPKCTANASPEINTFGPVICVNKKVQDSTVKTQLTMWCSVYC